MNGSTRTLSARPVLALVLSLVGALGLFAQATIQFAFTSDLHYGVTRKSFDGASNVDAKVVNGALVSKLNTIPVLSFAADGGVNAGKDVGPVDFVVIGGDIANREEGTQEKAIQSSATSWGQFKADYIDNLIIRKAVGAYAPLYIIPGNHEVSNAIGYYKDMYPKTDATSIAEIYNMEMKAQTPVTPANYDYGKNRINYSFDINAKDKFENLMADKFADGKKTINDPSTIEQAAFQTWLKGHQNLTAYFHGNTNFNQFYDYTGTDGAIALNTIRVDSPMKGEISGSDETKLSFQVVTIDTATRTMTVREALWNTDPSNPNAPIVWGASETIALFPRPAVK